MRIFIFPALLLLTAAAHAQQAVLEWGPELVVGAGTQDLHRPRIVLNGSGDPVVLWGSISPRMNWVAIGDGSAFSDPQSVHPASLQPLVDDWQGTGITAKGDTLHAAMKFMPASSGATYTVSSYDGGLSWNDTVRVVDGVMPQTRFSSVATSPEGSPMVLFMAFEPGDVDPRYMVAHMQNGAYLPPVPVSAAVAPGEVCDCCAGELIARNTDVVAVFRNNDENLRSIWAAISSDGGASFTQGAEPDATGWNVNGCPASGPHAVILGDSLFTVWMSAAQNGSKVFIRSTHLQDLGQATMLKLHPGQPDALQQNHPRIAGHGDTLGVVWRQTQGAQHEILFAFSTSGSDGFGPPDTVNNILVGTQTMPDVVFANGTFHFVWSDLGANTIQYRTANVVGATGLSPVRAPSGLALYPVPASDQLHLAQPPPGSILRITDAHGRVLREVPASPVVDVKDLPAGMYLLHMLHLDHIPAAVGRFVIYR